MLVVGLTFCYHEHSEQARAPHKRTEGRAPVWGSELTSKDAALQGGMMVVLMQLLSASSLDHNYSYGRDWTATPRDKPYTTPYKRVK